MLNATHIGKAVRTAVKCFIGMVKHLDDEGQQRQEGDHRYDSAELIPEAKLKTILSEVADIQPRKSHCWP